jgi:hypothetical protein
MKQAVNGVHDWLNDLVAYVTKIANGDMTASMAKASERGPDSRVAGAIEEQHQRAGADDVDAGQGGR